MKNQWFKTFCNYLTYEPAAIQEIERGANRYKEPKFSGHISNDVIGLKLEAPIELTARRYIEHNPSVSLKDAIAKINDRKLLERFYNSSRILNVWRAGGQTYFETIDKYTGANPVYKHFFIDIFTKKPIPSLDNVFQLRSGAIVGVYNTFLAKIKIYKFNNLLEDNDAAFVSFTSKEFELFDYSYVLAHTPHGTYIKPFEKVTLNEAYSEHEVVDIVFQVGYPENAFKYVRIDTTQREPDKQIIYNELISLKSWNNELFKANKINNLLVATTQHEVNGQNRFFGNLLVGGSTVEGIGKLTYLPFSSNWTHAKNDDWKWTNNSNRPQIILSASNGKNIWDKWYIIRPNQPFKECFNIDLNTLQQKFKHTSQFHDALKAHLPIKISLDPKERSLKIRLVVWSNLQQGDTNETNDYYLFEGTGPSFLKNAYEQNPKVREWIDDFNRRHNAWYDFNYPTSGRNAFPRGVNDLHPIHELTGYFRDTRLRSFQPDATDFYLPDRSKIIAWVGFGKEGDGSVCEIDINLSDETIYDIINLPGDRRLVGTLTRDPNRPYGWYLNVMLDGREIAKKFFTPFPIYNLIPESQWGAMTLEKEEGSYVFVSPHVECNFVINVDTTIKTDAAFYRISFTTNKDTHADNKLIFDRDGVTPIRGKSGRGVVFNENEIIIPTQYADEYNRRSWYLLNFKMNYTQDGENLVEQPPTTYARSNLESGLLLTLKTLYEGENSIPWLVGWNSRALELYKPIAQENLEGNLLASFQGLSDSSDNFYIDDFKTFFFREQNVFKALVQIGSPYSKNWTIANIKFNNKPYHINNLPYIFEKQDARDNLFNNFRISLVQASDLDFCVSVNDVQVDGKTVTWIANLEPNTYDLEIQSNQIEKIQWLDNNANVFAEYDQRIRKRKGENIQLSLTKTFNWVAFKDKQLNEEYSRKIANLFINPDLGDLKINSLKIIDGLGRAHFLDLGVDHFNYDEATQSLLLTLKIMANFTQSNRDLHLYLGNKSNELYNYLDTITFPENKNAATVVYKILSLI